MSITVLVGIVGWMSTLDRTAKPMNINGDTLGRSTSESLQDYERRAENTLAQAPAATPGFALVTFQHPVTAAEAGAIVDGAALRRVNAVVFDGAVPIALPEPVGAETRADVLSRVIARAAAAEHEPTTSPQFLIQGLVVFDDGLHLRLLKKQSPTVLTVEVLPPDAAWGRFGVQPVLTGR